MKQGTMVITAVFRDIVHFMRCLIMVINVKKVTIYVCDRYNITMEKVYIENITTDRNISFFNPHFCAFVIFWVCFLGIRIF